MKHYAHLQDLAALVGTEIGVSDWVAVDQPRIDLFAEATGDHQWIHLDAERARRGPMAPRWPMASSR
jgi:acyl dehydratase